MGCSGSVPSHGNPKSSNRLNRELNNVARNTNNCGLARQLVSQGASLSSTNGPHWRHTPLHQAAYHGRYDMAKTLIELGAPLKLHSNPCGRGANGTPLELARGGGHHRIAELIERALKGDIPLTTPQDPLSAPASSQRSTAAVGQFVFSGHVGRNKFDEQGVLFALGDGGNPFENGVVKVHFSSDCANYYSTVHGHEQGEIQKSAKIICANAHWGSNATQWSKGAPGAWFALELPDKLKLSHYCYRGDYGGGGNHPRSWDLQGSLDGKSWLTLRSHRNDGSVTNDKCGSWPVSCDESYSWFRIQNTGAPNHLCCSGIEFYGQMGDPVPQFDDLPPPPAFDEVSCDDTKTNNWGHADTSKGTNVD